MADTTTVRAYVRDELAPLCPAEWVWIAEQRMPDVLSKVTVVIKHSGMTSLPQAPIGYIEHELVLSVFSPLGTTDAAEDNLDDAVTTLITVLDGHGQINWTNARKVLSPSEKNLGWDIQLTTTSTKE